MCCLEARSGFAQRLGACSDAKAAVSGAHPRVKQGGFPRGPRQLGYGLQRRHVLLGGQEWPADDYRVSTGRACVYG
jgi:hypothetical protein